MFLMLETHVHDGICRQACWFNNSNVDLGTRNVLVRYYICLSNCKTTLFFIIYYDKHKSASTEDLVSPQTCKSMFPVLSAYAHRHILTICAVKKEKKYQMFEINYHQAVILCWLLNTPSMRNRKKAVWKIKRCCKQRRVRESAIKKG